MHMHSCFLFIRWMLTLLAKKYIMAACFVYGHIKSVYISLWECTKVYLCISSVVRFFGYAMHKTAYKRWLRRNSANRATATVSCLFGASITTQNHIRRFSRRSNGLVLSISTYLQSVRFLRFEQQCHFLVVKRCAATIFGKRSIGQIGKVQFVLE